MALHRSARLMVARGIAVTLLISAVGVDITLVAPAALASGTVLFNQPFHDNTVDGTAGSVSLPASPTGVNSACLTAAGNATANPLASCTSATDPQGSGTLRLTANSTTLEGGIFASTTVPTSQGLDVTFNSYQYGGTNADGIAFVLAAVNPANPQIPAVMGQSGGSLGYSAKASVTPALAGLTDGYMGVGIDSYGNFSNKYEGTGCTDPPNIDGAMPGEVVVRGPGNGTVGYCAVQSSAATATSQKLTLRATTRAASLVPMEVVFNPSSSAVTTPSGLVVPGGDYDVTFTPVGGTKQSLVDPLPVVPSGLYPASWVNANGIPKQLAFGWVASTGASTDYHEISNVVVSSLNPVPQLAVSQTSYAAATLVPGSPVTYQVAASSSGAPENQPVTVTETLPAGVLPVSAFGTGWTCGAPNGQQISCTSSSSPFTSGTITVNGVVNSSSVTPALIQTSTTAIASSGDANPGTSSSAPAGTVPAAPVVTSISPTNGAAGGGNDVTVSGTNLSGATAIEIGTAAEFGAGTPTTLNLCSSSGPGCFTVTSATSLDISDMPGHTAGLVQVHVVSLGIAGTGSYTYNAGPALLFPPPPGGEVGVAYSDQLTVTGGTSPFTWSISSGTLPPGLTLSASTGLLSGTPTTAGSYAFTVKVTDSSGLSDTEAASVSIISGPSLNFAAPAAGWTHTVYSDTLTVSGGTAPYTWSVSSGSLPAGISLSADGNLTGTPTATGTFSFTVKVTDANSQSATQVTSITVSPGVSTTFSAPPAAVIGTAYTDTLTATGGTMPYTWSVNAGALPPGITLSAAGVLAGTPTTAGSYPFSVNVVDANNGIATASITLVVTAVLALTFGAPPGGQVGFAYSDTLTAAGGTPPYTWSVSSGALPAGLTLNASTGVIAGTPTAGGTTSFTVKVTDSAGKTATQPTSITVVAGILTIAASANVTTTTPGGTVGYTVTVTNTGPIAYAAATFTVPLGGILDDAAYNGNAAASAGSVSFASPSLTWTGSLATGASATVTFSVTVNNPDTGDHVLSSTVTSATPGASCPAGGGGAAACTATVNVAQLTIVNSSNVSSTTPGSVVRFTATFTNAGQVPYTGITITTNAADVFDDAVPNGDQTATSGVLSITGTSVAWTGSIPVGGTVTVTGTVTVNNPDTGNKLLASTITTAAAGSNCPSGTTDPRCSVGVPVLVPALTISQAASTTTAVPGQQIGLTVTITDTGPTSYAGVTVTDSLAQMLDDASYDNDAATATGTVSYSAPVITWTGSLTPGATAVITFTVTVNNPDTGDKLVIAAVSSAATGSTCPPGTTAVPCRITVPVLTPGLTIVKTASTSTPVPGQQVTYTITVTDTGQTPYAGASFTDDLTGVLDDAHYNNDAATGTGSVTYTAPVLSWTGNLNPGGTAVITYSVTISNPDTGDLILTNTVVSPTPGSNCPAAGPDPRCTVTLTIVSAATLTITNTAAAPSAVAGATVHYTITIANSGLTDYTGATLTDNLAGITGDAAYNGDATITAGTGTLAYTAPDLTWTGTVPASGSVTITFTATVHNPDTGSHLLTAVITSASFGSNCPVTGGTDPRCTATVTVSRLTITAAWETATTTPGSVLGFTAAYANTGQTPYLGITIATDLTTVFANAVSNGDQAASSGTLSVTAAGASWTGDIPVGQTITITGTITINNPDTGSRTLQPVVSTTAPGSNCPAGSTDPRCAPVATVDVPALTISQSASATAPVPGQQVGLTLTITNTGQTPYTAATVTDSLAQMLDDGSYDGDAAASTGTITYTAPVLTWTGDLPPGGSVVITFSVTVSNPDTGDKLIIVTAASAATGSTCPPGTTTAPCRITVAVLTPALTITKTASVPTATPGSTVTYTITIDNTGQTTYTAASVTDDLSGVLADAAYDNDATTTATGTGTGTVSYAAPVLTWTGSLNPGDTATITYSVTVLNPDTGTRTLTNTAATTAAGANCPSGSADPRCTATVTITAGLLTITAPATASLGTGTPGTTITGDLGTTQVTDDRGFGASWTVTVSATPFTTGGGTEAETIPPANVTYTITGLSQATGTATFTTTPATTLTTTPQDIVTATNVGGNTTATWNPQIQVTIPPSAIAGQYTATITQSVS